jgi:transposase
MNSHATARSTLGRPRRLTDAQIAAILDWHRNRKSYKQVAREYGVSVNTIKYVIRHGGQYKQCDPAQRAFVVERRCQVIANLRKRGFMD